MVELKATVVEPADTANLTGMRGITLAGMRDVQVITTPHEANPCERLLGDKIFYGPGVGHQLTNFADVDGCAIFGYSPDVVGLAHGTA